MAYYKITNEKENHNNLQYQDGLVEDILPFQKEGSCVPGGIYFSDEKHILEFIDYGIWIREVGIPEDVEMVKDPEGNKWRASKVYLHPRKDLREVETWKWMKNIGIDISKYSMFLSSRFENLRIIKFLVEELNIKSSSFYLTVNYDNEDINNYILKAKKIINISEIISIIISIPVLFFAFVLVMLTGPQYYNIIFGLLIAILDILYIVFAGKTQTKLMLKLFAR